jgi:serine protease Do
MTVTVWKGAMLAAALVAAVGVGATMMPPARAQNPARVVSPKAVQILNGRGSQIGVTIRDIEESDTKTGKLAVASGVVIEEVSEDSPAAKAGLKKGDIVVEFDGERVRSVRQFTRLVQETPAGRKAQTSVMRDGQKLNLTVEPRDGAAFSYFGDDKVSLLRDLAGDSFVNIPRPAAPARPATPVPPKPPALPAFPDFDTFVWRTGNTLGITVGDLSDQLAQYFGTKDGVLVTSVADDSAAAKAGVKAGDVITSLNGTDVTSPSNLRSRIQRLQDGDEFTVGIVRDKKSMTLKGKAETLRPRRTTRAII